MRARYPCICLSAQIDKNKSNAACKFWNKRHQANCWLQKTGLACKKMDGTRALSSFLAWWTRRQSQILPETSCVSAPARPPLQMTNLCQLVAQRLIVAPCPPKAHLIRRRRRNESLRQLRRDDTSYMAAPLTANRSLECGQRSQKK